MKNYRILFRDILPSPLLCNRSGLLKGKTLKHFIIKAIASLHNKLQSLLQAKIPNLVANGDTENRLTGNLHISIANVPNRIRKRLNFFEDLQDAMDNLFWKLDRLEIQNPFFTYLQCFYSLIDLL